MMQRPRANKIHDRIRQLGSRNKSRVDEAREHLSLVGGRAVEQLVEALEGNRNRVRANVMPLLAMIQDPRGRDPLIAMLLDRDTRMRRIAARSLARFPSPESVVALNRLLDREPRAEVRKTAVQSLVEHYAAGQDQAICRVLEILLDSTRADATRLAAFSLLRVLPGGERVGIVTRLQRDPKGKIRRKAEELESGEPVRFEQRQARGWMDGLGSNDYDSWMEAVQRLGGCGSRIVAPLVDEMELRAHDPDYCTRAGIALKALGRRSASALVTALERVEHPFPAQVLVEAVGAIGEKAATYRLKDLIERLARRRGRDALPPQTVVAPAGRAEAEDAVPRSRQLDADHDALAHESTDGFDPWLRVRAKAHLELARLGSRVAMADLRAAFDAADRRVDLELLAAMRLIGKRDEVGLLLRVHTEEDPFVQGRIAEVVRAIMKRERIRRNSRFFQSLEANQRHALARILLATSPRTRRRRRPRKARAVSGQSGRRPDRML